MRRASRRIYEDIVHLAAALKSGDFSYGDDIMRGPK
jgi:hypothetical protein